MDVFENVMQIRFEDYTDVAGIKATSVADSTAPVEYFNIQGVRVQGDLVPGIYIRKQGTQVTKILK